MALETITIEMPCDQAVEIFRFCSEHRLTLDELVDQFMRWCIQNPEAFKDWFTTNQYLLELAKHHHSLQRALSMPEITEDELIAHWEDDDFLLKYGNPLLIRGKDGHHDCVLMSIEYYERIQKDISRLKDEISQIGSERNHEIEE